MRGHPDCHVVVTYRGVTKFLDLWQRFRKGLALSPLQPNYEEASDSTDPLEHCQLPALGDTHFLFVVRLVYGDELHNSMDWIFYKKFELPTVLVTKVCIPTTSNTQVVVEQVENHLNTDSSHSSTTLMGHNAIDDKQAPEPAFCSNCDRKIQHEQHMCGSCHVDTYCSKQCQRAAFKQHRPICKKLQALERKSATIQSRLKEELECMQQIEALLSQ